MSAEFKLIGVDKLLRNLKDLQRKQIDRAKIALRLEAEWVMTLAKQRYVPVAEIRGGTLRNSGFVGRVEESAGELSVRLGFGGRASAYALALHEHPSEHSPFVWEGKVLKFHLGGEVGVKYLERPLRASEPGMAERLAVHMRLS